MVAGSKKYPMVFVGMFDRGSGDDFLFPGHGNSLADHLDYDTRHRERFVDLHCFGDLRSLQADAASPSFQDGNRDVVHLDDCDGGSNEWSGFRFDWRSSLERGRSFPDVACGILDASSL